MESINEDKEEILNYCELNPAEYTQDRLLNSLQDLVHNRINALCTII